MIKKFNEHINESKRLSGEDLEDNFLRLKEIFGCDIIIKMNKDYYGSPVGRMPTYSIYGNILVFIPSNSKTLEAMNEFDNSVKRLEIGFPKYKFTIDKLYDQLNSANGFSIMNLVRRYSVKKLAKLRFDSINMRMYVININKMIEITIE